ncbi:MAG: reverse transcriptase/maturase family protein [Bacteroidota bacterium]
MKRVSQLYQQIYSLENLRLADTKARKGKLWQYGVSRLPYYPDRITHHAVMNILKPVFVSVFTRDTYSCIEGRGIHAAARAVRKALRDAPGTQYCLKMDVKKFYPSIDHEVMKGLLRRKFKDTKLQWLLDEIIDSAPGLPIGNYLSQYLANFYLTYFDHWIKEQKRVRYYFRYADDLVILASGKQELHGLFKSIQQYLLEHLKLEVKPDWQIFPVSARGIDFVGYRFYHTHVRLRKTIKQNFARMLATRPNYGSIMSYLGWTGHCNANHLTKTLLHDLFFTTQHQATGYDIHRGQDQAEQDTQPVHHGSVLQNRTVKVSGERQRQKINAADPVKWNAAHSVQRIGNVDGNDRTGTERQIPGDHHN